MSNLITPRLSNFVRFSLDQSLNLTKLPGHSFVGRHLVDRHSLIPLLYCLRHTLATMTIFLLYFWLNDQGSQIHYIGYSIIVGYVLSSISSLNNIVNILLHECSSNIGISRDKLAQGPYSSNLNYFRT